NNNSKPWKLDCQNYKNHDITVNDLNDMKSRYQECLSKINELYLRLAESQSEELKNYTPSTPMTPISPTSSVDRMSLSQTFIYSESSPGFRKSRDLEREAVEITTKMEKKKRSLRKSSAAESTNLSSRSRIKTYKDKTWLAYTSTPYNSTSIHVPTKYMPRRTIKILQK
ncbi:8591_t:CDS:2, partial [Acaulospora morrowiae]